MCPSQRKQSLFSLCRIHWNIVATASNRRFAGQCVICYLFNRASSRATTTAVCGGRLTSTGYKRCMLTNFSADCYTSVRQIVSINLNTVISFWLCTTAVHNTALNSSDHLPSYPPDNRLLENVVVVGCGDQRSRSNALLYLSNFLLLFACNEVKNNSSTFTCNEVNFFGHFQYFYFVTLLAKQLRYK